MEEQNNRYISRDEINKVFSSLDGAGTVYALKTNNGNELPDRLTEGKDIDLLVLPDDIEKLRTALEGIGFHRIAAFKGTGNGYRFAYGLIENQIFRKNTPQGGLYVDADFALMCMSLQPKIWIPLDKAITRDAFANRVYNQELKCWELDEETRLIYLLARCVFDKHQFTDVYIREIEKRRALMNRRSVAEKLQKVFFRFTPRLISMLNAREYQNIFNAYITFQDY